MLLYQPESGYCYNSDSIFLYDFINQFTPRGKLLDIGAGCGIVGLLVARDNPSVILEAVEKQEVFIHFSKKNAAINKIEYKLHECDFLELETQTKYDYIISNPPFYPVGAKKSTNEILFNARYNVNLPLSSLFKKVSQLLKPHSHFVFCYDATQFGDICEELAKVRMRVVDVQFVHPKIDKTASLVLIHARNGSKSQMKVMPPLISNDGENPSEYAKKLYEKANTQSIKCTI